MFFPLLEALLQKNQDLCKQRIHAFLQSDEDPSAIYKGLFTYASQHAISDNSGLDAMVVTDGLVNVFRTHYKTLSPMKQEVLFGHGIDYLCRIPIESIDTTALKPSREEAKVISISDLEESFEQSDVNLVVASVKDLLTLMDNKHYFMEIIYQIALHKSPQSLVLTSATSRAIEIMGWQNNFTPFLIYHLIVRMFHDKNRIVFSEKSHDEGDVFDQCLAGIQSTSDLQFLSAAYRTHNDCNILATKIRAKIRIHLVDYFRSKGATRRFTEKGDSAIEQILCQSCLEDLSPIQGIEVLQSKNPFVV